MSWMGLSVLAYFVTGLIFAISVFYRGKSAARTTARALVLGTFAFAMLTVHGDTVWDLYITVLQTQDITALVKQDRQAFKRVTTAIKRVTGGDSKNSTTKAVKKLSRREKRERRRANKRAKRPPKALPAKRAHVAARVAKDRKYELIYGLCLLAVLLYIFTKPSLWGFVERLFLAARGVSTLNSNGSSSGGEVDEDIVSSMKPVIPDETQDAEDSH